MKKYQWYQKLDPVRDYFPLPNAIFSLDLTAADLAVYSYLMRCEDRKTHQCYPSYKTIGKAVHLSVNTVMKHVNRLRDLGLIDAEPTQVFTKDGMKKNGSLLYTIRPIAEVIQKYNERQLSLAKFKWE